MKADVLVAERRACGRFIRGRQSRRQESPLFMQCGYYLDMLDMGNAGTIEYLKQRSIEIIKEGQTESGAV